MSAKSAAVDTGQSSIGLKAALTRVLIEKSLCLGKRSIPHQQGLPDSSVHSTGSLHSDWLTHATEMWVPERVA